MDPFPFNFISQFLCPFEPGFRIDEFKDVQYAVTNAMVDTPREKPGHAYVSLLTNRIEVGIDMFYERLQGLSSILS